MKLKIFLLTFVALFMIGFSGWCHSTAFRVVGYYSLREAMDSKGKHVPFDKLTHVNLWFLNPDSLGNFTTDLTRLAPFIRAAHKKNVKVLFSIGGGSRQSQYHALLENDKREMFIRNLITVAVNNNADGIDVDLEGDDIDSNYEDFVVELASTLRKHDKLITAAVAVYYKDQLTDKALLEYDFVNVMSYDRTGPWRPEKPGPHSTYADAVEDLYYFGVIRKIPSGKMTLGVPFYGYGFGPEIDAEAISMNYKKIVSTFRGAESFDQWTMPGGKIIYYNGIPTIKQKTVLAKEKASGIMIWQLQGDAKGSKSLLRAIAKTASAK